MSCVIDITIYSEICPSCWEGSQTRLRPKNATNVQLRPERCVDYRKYIYCRLIWIDDGLAERGMTWQLRFIMTHTVGIMHIVNITPETFFGLGSSVSSQMVFRTGADVGIWTCVVHFFHENESPVG